MLTNWFKTQDVDEFADSLVAEVQRRFPPTGIDVAGRKQGERLKRIHDALFGRVREYASTASLNIYRRARLGNRVRWALREAGYPAQFVDAFTHELVTVVTLGGRGAGGPNGSAR